MRLYSTGLTSPEASLTEAILNGYAPDGGLYMPVRLPFIPTAFFNNIGGMSSDEITYVTGNSLFGEEISADTMKEAIADTIDIDTPLAEITPGILGAELYHGPTLSAMDIGATLLAKIISNLGLNVGDPLNILVATSRDTGVAMAKAFDSVPGINLFALYPSRQITDIAESQLSSIQDKATVIEVHGDYGDCHNLAKTAILDNDLRGTMKLTSANSINIVTFLSKILHFIYPYAKAVATGVNPSQIVMAFPAGNLSTLSAGIIAKRMGLTVKRFIVTGNSPMSEMAWRTNLPRFKRLCNGLTDCNDIIFMSTTDDMIIDTIAEVYFSNGHLLDQDTAAAYLSLRESLKPGETGIVLECSHPIKSRNAIEKGIGYEIPAPPAIKRLHPQRRNHEKMSANYAEFKQFLISRL